MLHRRRSGPDVAPEPNVLSMIGTIVLAPTAFVALLFALGALRRMLD